MTVDAWEKSGKYLLHKDRHQIFYKTAPSEKEVLLLLHGFPTSSWDWVKMWNALEKKYSLVSLDYLGYGLSDKPFNYSYSTFDQADIVELLLKVLKIDKIHILAHDYGDTVCQELLHRFQNKKNYPIDIQSVCLLNGGILQGGYRPRVIQKLLASPFGFLLSPFLNKALLRRNFNRIFGPNTQASSSEIDAFYGLLKYKGGRYILPKTIRYLHERVKYEDRWTQALQECTLPICMINGNLDPISGKHLSILSREMIPQMKVYDLKEIGHYPQTEDPETVLKHFFEFIIK